jgi:putative ABC transport system permease protein
MSPFRLAAKSLRYYWRTSLSVVLAVTVAAGVLTGALVVGDSVQYTLRRAVGLRLGQSAFAVVPQNRYFRSVLADEISKRIEAPVAAVLQAPGMIANEDGSRRINRATVLGVDESFFRMGPEPRSGMATGGGVVLSQAAAVQLGVTAGDEVLLRAEKPGLMPRDVPLAPDADRVVAVRLKVRAIADEASFGRFDLQANQAAPPNVFVPRDWLARQLDQVGRANLLLAAESSKARTAEEANQAVRDCWTIADAGLEIRHLSEPNVLELRSRRVFMEDSLAAAAMQIDANAVGIFAYFVNEIRLGDKATPYSMVAAMDAWPGLRPDQIVINEWLAEDLGAKVGDALTLRYYVVGASQELREESAQLTVAQIVPLQGPAADPNLMPAFPGLADVENCRDWKPGIPIKLDSIRPKDEAYWNAHRGTPKAFVTLQAGRSMWRNRFGSLTAVRYPWRPGLDRQVAARLCSQVDPAAVGLFFQPVRQRGLAAGKGGTDFGQLFLGLSMFLIAAAIILTGLLFVFGVESRAQEIGLLLAVGLPPKRVRRLFLIEGGLLSLLGTLGGLALGLLYTRLMVYGLSTLWSGAVANAPILFHARPTTLGIGGLASMVVAWLAVVLALRKHVSRPAVQLLAGDIGGAVRPGRRRHWDAAVAGASLVFALGTIALSSSGDSQATAGGFFAAGGLLLVAGIASSRVILRRLGASRARWARPTLRALGWRSTARRSGRSLAIIGLLACGVFMVVAVGANRHDPLAQPSRRDSGTGGFAFYGESSVAILHDLNTQAGRNSLHLNDSDMRNMSIVPFRVHDGDDASCLNLNRAQRPRLLAVRPGELSRRQAFRFTAMTKGASVPNGWDLLSTDLGKDVVPAVGDYPTVFWGLGKKIGDELQYEDESGRPFRVRIVGMLDSSILQGSLVIAEDRFRERFPSEAGYRTFLVDAPEGGSGIAQTLSVRLSDFGMVLTTTQERLAAFSQVENTYLSIFTMLGGFGLILGSVGLGLVVLRNLLERRGELSMLRAVGFSRRAVQIMVFYEHWGLVLLGIFCGVIAALVAVIPAMHSPGGQIPYVGLALMVLGIAAGTGCWIWIASALALRGPLLDSLRNE